MSEYAYMKIRNMTLFSFRNYLDSNIVSKIFNSDDLKTIENYFEDTEDEDAKSITRYLYQTTVLKAKERLDAQGYTLSKFKNIFENSLIQAIDYSPFLYHLNIDFDEQLNKAKERIRRYSITFRQWMNSMKKIIEYELLNGKIWQENKEVCKRINVNTECDKIIYYSLVDEDSESYYAINTNLIDQAYIIRLILELCANDELIELDFTNLQYWDDDCITKGSSATEDIEKTIVLVEGSTDKEILEFSIKYLYPHLADLFYFMDFDDNNGKRDGGTSYVIKNLKTFYFSKIRRNFIAIFDNDAEGYASKCTLLNEMKQWPSNFKILLYPELPLLKKYPTIAPNGETVLDNINRKAASIELYLPDSIIKKEGSYLPIEWETRKKIKNNKKYEFVYQGVISDKENIIQEFHNMKNSIEKQVSSFAVDDWNRMEVLLDTIVFAFR